MPLMAALLAIVLAVGYFIHAERISLFYRMHVRAPLTATCSRTPPEWFSLLTEWAARHDVGGLQVHARIGQATYDCGFGSALIADGSEESMTAETTIPYASLTKVLTSAFALRQAQLGSVSIDANVSEALALDELALRDPDKWEKITLEMLLMHRAGFDRAISGDSMSWRQPPCPDNLEGLRNVPIDFEPGRGFAYSNLGYCLAALVLERAAGKDFSAMLRTELLDPLGLPFLELASLDDLRAHRVALRVQHLADEEHLRMIDWRALAGVGNLAGTAHDFGKFLRELLNGSGALGEVGDRLMTPLPNCDETRWRRCHGLAFYSHRGAGRRRMFWRDGSQPGVTAFAAVTETGDVFVLLGNGRDPAKWLSIHDELGRIVYDHL